MTRRALVTGASRGIGLAIAQVLAADGVEVLSAARTPAPGKDDPATFRQVDLADAASTHALAELLTHESIDILVNCAGINRISPYAQIEEDDLRAVLEVNLVAPMLLTRSVLPHMTEQGWGRIINIASIWGQISKAQRAAYSASKAGLIGMTRALAAEVASQGILVNAVSPGVCETSLTRDILGNAGIAEIARTIPIGRLGHVEEIAAVVRFLASDEASYISGQSIVVDGGFVNV